jgi:TRAP-type C4-dicarboxylate transport system permease small subunit
VTTASLPGGGGHPARRAYAAAERAVALLARLVRWTVAFMAAVILLTTAAAVVDRHVFGTTFDAYDQYARLGLVWMTFLGFALALRERHTIRVEILDGLLGPRARFWRETIFDGAVLALAVLLVVKGWAVAEVGTFQDIIGTPFTYAWSYTAIPAAACLICLFLTLRIVGRCLGAPVDEPAHHDGVA